MGITAGEVLGIKAPAAGQTTRLPIMLLDTSGNPVTGVTFDATGVTVQVAKEGASAFVDWTTLVGNAFATGNWDEVGYGNYDVILSGDVAGEAAVLNTEGHLRLYVKFTATRGDTFLYKVNVADSVRDDQWTDGRAAFLTDLANRLTSLRAGYLDALNITGLVASAADVSAVTQAQRVRVIPPPMMERPDAGSATYRLWIYAYDEQHKAENLDTNPTVTAENNAGTDRSANLGTVTKPGGTTGQYYVDYTVALAHAIEGLVFKVDATEGSITTGYAASSIVVDTTAVDFTATDRLDLQAIAGKLPAGDLAETGEAATAVSALNDLNESQVLAQVNAALDAAMPGTPTPGSVNDLLKALVTLLQASGTGDAAATKEAAELVASLIENHEDYQRFKATALEEAPSGGGISQEEAQAAAAAALAAYDAATAADLSALQTHGDTNWSSDGTVVDLVDSPNPDALSSIAEAVAAQLLGSGSTVVSLAVKDEDEAPVHIAVSVYNSDGTRLVRGATDTSTGIITFNLDVGEGYYAVLGPDPSYDLSNPYEFDVTELDEQTVNVEVENLIYDTDPVAADRCRLYGYVRPIDGVSASSVKLYVKSITGRPDASVLYTLPTEPKVSDLAGYVYVDIPRECEVVIELSSPGVSSVGQTVEVPDAAEMNLGTISAFQTILQA